MVLFGETDLATGHILTKQQFLHIKCSLHTVFPPFLRPSPHFSSCSLHSPVCKWTSYTLALVADVGKWGSRWLSKHAWMRMQRECNSVPLKQSFNSRSQNTCIGTICTAEVPHHWLWASAACDLWTSLPAQPQTPWMENLSEMNN